MNDTINNQLTKDAAAPHTHGGTEDNGQFSDTTVNEGNAENAGSASETAESAAGDTGNGAETAGAEETASSTTSEPNTAESSVSGDESKDEAEEITFPRLQANAKKLVADAQALGVNVVELVKETAGL